MGGIFSSFGKGKSPTQEKALQTCYDAFPCLKDNSCEPLITETTETTETYCMRRRNDNTVLIVLVVLIAFYIGYSIRK